MAATLILTAVKPRWILRGDLLSRFVVGRLVRPARSETLDETRNLWLGPQAPGVSADIVMVRY
jgi:hypothetical protein